MIPIVAYYSSIAEPLKVHPFVVFATKENSLLELTARVRRLERDAVLVDTQKVGSYWASTRYDVFKDGKICGILNIKPALDHIEAIENWGDFCEDIVRLLNYFTTWVKYTLNGEDALFLQNATRNVVDPRTVEESVGRFLKGFGVTQHRTHEVFIGNRIREQMSLESLFSAWIQSRKFINYQNNPVHTFEGKSVIARFFQTVNPRTPYGETLWTYDQWVKRGFNSWPRLLQQRVKIVCFDDAMRANFPTRSFASFV